MSRRYKGAVISATPPTTTGGSSGTAPGEWTLQQQMQAQGGSVWPSQPPPNYIEDVFSTWIYFGNGATQTITNNIDLATKGGMVWGRPRDVASDFSVFDSIRGSNWIFTDGINAQQTNTGFAMTTTGFSMTNMSTSAMNYNGSGCVSWTFRKQPKFFDVVSWTGTGSNRTIAHNLGSVPGCIWVKRTDANGAWQVYHSSLANTEYLVLNTTAAKATGTTRWNSTTPTSTVFSVGTDATVNASGGTYVAYVFASNAGGFGLTGTDNVISCGSYTGNATAGNAGTLGYEPQWIMIKQAAGTDAGTNSWSIYDIMRGMPNGSANDNRLEADNSNAEVGYPEISPTATGFVCEATGGRLNASGGTYIYIAIRKGPMTIPTVGTNVFTPLSTSNGTLNGSFAYPDLLMNFNLAATAGWQFVDRLRGILDGFPSNTSGAVTTNPYIKSNTSAAEATSNTRVGGLGVARTGNVVGSWVVYDPGAIANGNYDTLYILKRAPSFFDEVCYTGTGSATTITHNLTVVPELMIVKDRSSATNWYVYNKDVGNQSALLLNATNAPSGASPVNWNSTTPTSTVFSIGTTGGVNTSGDTYVAYLFATCAGVSKVGSYTGTGATQTIDCGFTGGARWVMVKRTDSTGDWYVWDTARGMVSGTDPSLLFNSASAEVNANSVYTTGVGFQIVSTAAGINASGGTYIFLAIA